MRIASLIGIAAAAASMGLGCGEVSPSGDLPLHGDVAVVRQELTDKAGWTGFMSEEFGGPLECPAGFVAVGSECNGSYCDQVRIMCDYFGGGLGTNASWTHWVESNGHKQARCPGDNSWMIGMDCRGNWCDDVRVQCGYSNTRSSNCSWSSWYSEEDAPFVAADGRWIRGVECSGTHCDNKRYWTCEPRPPAEYSCQSRCGTVATGGTCWCDSSCDFYGDCCSDRNLWCDG